MAKKKATKSDFLRKILGNDAGIDHRQVNAMWAKAGNEGEISSSLYHKVRAELGIKTEWTWVEVDAEDRPARPKDAGTGELYQLKITLLDTKPPIWRRIQVVDCSLDRLHEHIQAAMGWTNSHLHDFRVGDGQYGDPRLLAETFEELGYADSTRVTLGEIIPEDARRFRLRYEYDFGDGWTHEILFERRSPAEPGRRYPLCMAGARACPPEDVGGVWGYADFLEAIGDPKDGRHDEMREWAGDTFDPEAFDPSEATTRMIKGLPGWR